MIPLGVLGAAHVPAAGGLSYRDEVLADSPHCYFPLDDASTITDVMGNVTPSSSAGVTLGAAGIGDGATAATFDGGSVGRGIILPAADLAPLTNVGAFTVEVIAKATNMTGKRALWARERYYLARHENTAAWSAFTGVGWANAIGSTTSEPSPTTTHHIAMVWDGSTATFYRDGAPLMSEAQSGSNLNPTGHNLYIGSRAATDDTFLGTLAGFAAYPGALSAARILAHAQAAGVA